MTLLVGQNKGIPALTAHVLLLAIEVVSLFYPINTNFNIVATAALTVYAGCWRSVKEAPPTESMTKNDAMRFPLVGSCVLFSLFLAFKFLPKEVVNGLLTAYIGVVAIFALTNVSVPFLKLVVPAHVYDKSVTLPAIKIPHLFDNTQDPEPTKITYLEMAVAAVSCCFFAWYAFTKHWFANNAIGLMFSLEGIEHLSLGSFHVGAILLGGLFIYDIFWVFCTPVMVSVAKNFDAPIKLLFPRAGGLLANGKRPFSMLGLGDIVIPGVFVALMLRYDASRKFESKYFQSAFGGYTAGLITTIVVMNYFEAAQPALLYIVPGVLGAVLLHAMLKGELKSVLDFSEGTAKDEEEAAAAKLKSSQQPQDGSAATAAAPAGAGAPSTAPIKPEVKKEQ